MTDLTKNPPCNLCSRPLCPMQPACRTSTPLAALPVPFLQDQYTAASVQLQSRAGTMQRMPYRKSLIRTAAPSAQSDEDQHQHRGQHNRRKICLFRALFADPAFFQQAEDPKMAIASLLGLLSSDLQMRGTAFIRQTDTHRTEHIPRAESRPASGRAFRE